MINETVGMSIGQGDKLASKLLCTNTACVTCRNACAELTVSNSVIMLMH